MYWYPCVPNRIYENDDTMKRLDNDITWVAEAKKNGWRCLAIKTGSALTLWTRKRTMIVDPLLALRADLDAMMPNDTMLDGELLDKRTKDVKGIWYGFDIIVFRGTLVATSSLVTRRRMLDRIVRETDSIQLAQWVNLGKRQYYFDVLEDKINEGIVLKKLDSRYAVSTVECKVNPYWLKVKRTEKNMLQDVA